MNDLELRLNELRSLKQQALRRIHEVGKHIFGHLERKVLNCVITVAGDSPKSVSKIAAVLNENESNVRNAVEVPALEDGLNIPAGSDITASTDNSLPTSCVHFYECSSIQNNLILRSIKRISIQNHSK
jgi:hypothetical protein